MSSEKIINEKKKRKTWKNTKPKSDIETFSFDELNTIVKPECDFSEGDIIKIKKTGEMGIVTRTRIFGNSMVKTIVIKTKNEGKKIISVDEIEKNTI